MSAEGIPRHGLDGLEMGWLAGVGWLNAHTTGERVVLFQPDKNGRTAESGARARVQEPAGGS